MNACASCQQLDGISVLLGPHTALETFCFRETAEKVYLNVNPPDKADALPDENRKVGLDDVCKFTTQLGGFSPWDPRFGGKRPNITFC